MKLYENFKDTAFSFEEIKEKINTFINSETILETDKLPQGSKIVCDFAIIPDSEKIPGFLEVRESIWVANEFNQLDTEAVNKLNKEPIFFLQFFNPFSEKTLHLDYLASYLRLHYPNALILSDISYVIGHHPIYFENWGINEFYYVLDGKNYRIYRTARSNPSCDNFIDYYARRMETLMQMGTRTEPENIHTYATLWQIFKNGKFYYVKFP